MILHIDFWDSLDPNIFFLGLDSPDKKRLSGLEKIDLNKTTKISHEHP